MKNKKLLYIAAGVVIVSLIAGVIYKKKQNSKPEEVQIEAAEKRSIIETVSANGKIQPRILVKISPEISGEIIELPIKEGQQVVKGDLLVRINPELYTSAVQRAEAGLNTTKANLSSSKARLAQSKAQLVNAKASFERMEKLFKEGAIAQSEFDQAKANFEVAKSEVEAAEENVQSGNYSIKSAEATLKEASENLRRTTIVSPMDGTISALNVELGERVLGTLQNMGTEILRVANLQEMEVKVDVNENDIVRVHLSDTALVEIDAYPERKFKGIVTELANSAKVSGLSTDQVTNFEVKILILRSSYADLINPKASHLSPFRPGMSATVDIQTNITKNAISVPIQAVTTREDSAKVRLTGLKDAREEVVFVFDKSGIAKMKKVKTGIQDNKYIQILEGIAEKDEVISGPYDIVSKTLKEGTKVEKKLKK